MSRRLLFAAVPRRTGGVASPPEPPAVTFDHYVSPTGSSGNPGTLAAPWSLAYARTGAGGLIQPGDTVGMLDGAFIGNQVVTVAGAPGAPVTFRRVPGHRPKLVVTATAGTTGVLVTGSYTRLWGLEVTTTNTAPADSQTVVFQGTGQKAINCEIHDTGGNGIGCYDDAIGFEAYGNLIWGYGRQEVHENFAHGIYTQNVTGQKRFANNVIFHGYGYAIHAYTQEAHLTGFLFEDNCTFYGYDGWRVGGGAPVIDAILRRNYTYHYDVLGTGVYLGGSPASHDTALSDNYFVGGKPTLRLRNIDPAFALTGNYIRSGSALQGSLLVRTSGAAGYGWSGNQWSSPSTEPFSDEPDVGDASAGNLAWWQGQSGYGGSDSYSASAPSANKIVVLPNEYEAGRGHVVAYNWTGGANVAVDLSSVVSLGHTYEIRPVQRIYDAPLVSGTYAGGTVSVPCGTYTPDPPPGGAYPALHGANWASGPGFNAYLVTSSA